MQLRKFLISHYPELADSPAGPRIEGRVQPPTPQNEMLGSLLSMVWFAGISLLLGGSYIFNTLLQIPEPSWYITMKNNQMMCFVGLFLLNNFGAALMQTGAFEVYLNEVKVWSKLESGRMPTGQDIVDAFAKQGL